MNSSSPAAVSRIESPSPVAARLYRTIVADDEPLARQRLVMLLQSHADFQVVAECGDGRQLLDAVRAHAPDLVLLDVQMPLLDGLSAWRSLATAGIGAPLVIFVSAHAGFAVEAFEIRALDYLLKPVSRVRFAEALDRVRTFTGLPSGGAIPLSGPPTGSVPAPRQDLVVLKHDGEYHFVRVDDIVWAGAEGDFVKVHTTAGAHLVRRSLASLEAVLDPGSFLRIHRSHVVARRCIRKVFVVQRGDYAVAMTDGAELRVSRPYFDALRQFIAVHAM